MRRFLPSPERSQRRASKREAHCPTPTAVTKPRAHLQRFLAHLQLTEQVVQPLVAPFQVACVHDAHHVGCAAHQVLEVRVDRVKSLAIFRQLHADVGRADKDALQRLPLLLHVAPARQHALHRAQLRLPVVHHLLELLVALHVLAAAHVLQRQVVGLQRLGDRVVGVHLEDVGVLVLRERQLELRPRRLDLLELLLDVELLRASAAASACAGHDALLDRASQGADAYTFDFDTAGCFSETFTTNKSAHQSKSAGAHSIRFPKSA